MNDKMAKINITFKRVLVLFMVLGLMTTAGCALGKKNATIMVSMKNGEQHNDFYINSAILAIEEWNSDTSHKVKAALVRYDYNGDSPTMGEELIATLEKDKPVALVATSGVANDVVKLIPKIHAAGIPYFTQATETRLTSQRVENLFRIQSSDAVSCTLATKFISEDLKLKRIAVLYPEGDFGRNFKTDLERSASINNLQLVSVHPYFKGDGAGLDEAIKTINKSDAQICLLWPEYGGQSELIKAMEKTSFNMPFFGNCEFRYMGGDKGELKKYEGSFVMSPFMYLSSKAYWRDRMQSRFGLRPAESESPVIYDTVNHILTTLEESDSPFSPAQLIADLHEKSYAGVVGTYVYDEKGEGLRQTYIGQLVQGKVKFIKIEKASR